MEHQFQALTKDKETGQYVLPSGYEARRLTGGYHLVPTKSAAGVRVQVLSPWFAAALLKWREEWTRNEWGLFVGGCLSFPAPCWGGVVPKSVTERN